MTFVPSALVNSRPSDTYEKEDEFQWIICRQFTARFKISTHEKPAFRAGFRGKVAERMGFEPTPLQEVGNMDRATASQQFTMPAGPRFA
jgi:hypothetical protein